MDLRNMVDDYQSDGYKPDDANARVCQDIVLKAISLSTLSRNVTIKGGVVMRSITGDVRRATQDMDIDFIRYSLSDESIDRFIDTINAIDGISIKRIGEIEELSQQDYNGKRVYIEIQERCILERILARGRIVPARRYGPVRHVHDRKGQDQYCDKQVLAPET